MIRSPAFLAIVVTLASASSVAAQSDSPNPVFYESGPWKVEATKSQFCILTMTGLPDGKLKLSKGDAEPAYFNYQLTESLDYYARADGVEWRFDASAIGGRLLVGRYYQIRDDNWRKRDQSGLAEERFRRAEKLTISQNDETVVEIDLTGSMKAFDQLKKCAAQWPGATVPLAPPPAPPRRPAGSTNR